MSTQAERFKEAVKAIYETDGYQGACKFLMAKGYSPEDTEEYIDTMLNLKQTDETPEEPQKAPLEPSSENDSKTPQEEEEKPADKGFLGNLFSRN